MQEQWEIASGIHVWETTGLYVLIWGTLCKGYCLTSNLECQSGMQFPLNHLLSQLVGARVVLVIWPLSLVTSKLNNSHNS